MRLNCLLNVVRSALKLREIALKNNNNLFLYFASFIVSIGVYLVPTGCPKIVPRTFGVCFRGLKKLQIKGIYRVIHYGGIDKNIKFNTYTLLKTNKIMKQDI